MLCFQKCFNFASAVFCQKPHMLHPLFLEPRIFHEPPNQQTFLSNLRRNQNKRWFQMFVILLFASLAAATKRLKCFLIIATRQHMNENKVIVTDIFIKSVVMGARLLQQCWRFTLVYFSAYKSNGKCPNKRENLLAISRMCRDVETFFLVVVFFLCFREQKATNIFVRKLPISWELRLKLWRFIFRESVFFVSLAIHKKKNRIFLI